MPLGVPNPNPPTPTKTPKRKPSGGSSTSSIPTATPLGSGQRSGQQGPIAPTTLAPRNSPYSGFQSTPEYTAPTEWGGWGDAAPQRTQDYAGGVLGETFNAVSGGALDLRETNQQYYERVHGADAVKNARASGIDPAVFFAMTPATQQHATAWGGNAGNASSIIAQQQADFDARLGNQQNTNSFIDEFGALQENSGNDLLSQYTNSAATAEARYQLGVNQLEQGMNTDLGVMGQQRHRAINLAGDDNRAGLLHNANMRGVLDQQRGIRGQQFGDQQDYLNAQTGFLNDRQNNAFDRFGSNDQYMAGQSQDLLAQYGFNARGYEQEVQGAFADRNTQQRASASNAAATGAFSSAGFGDNNEDIAGQYQRSVNASGLGLDRSNEALDVRDRGIGQDRANLAFNYGDQQTGFASEAAGINNAQDRNRTGYESDLANFQGQYSANDRERNQLENVDKGLSSLAKEYGLREQDVRNQFENAVTGMGLDLQGTNQQLEQMLNSGNAALQAQALAFQQQMMALQ